MLGSCCVHPRKQTCKISKRRRSRKMFYSSGFHEWRESITQSIYSFFPRFCLWIIQKQQKNPNNGFSLKENHYVIIAIMIFISTDAHEVRKKAFGICHHNQSHKNVKKINKFIALVLWWCLMNQSRFLLTLCILFFSGFWGRSRCVLLFCVFFTVVGCFREEY